VEDRGLDKRSVLVVDTRRSAREDHAHDVATLQLFRRDVVREDLAVHARLTNAARDELRVLGSVVEDGDRRSALLGGLPLRRLEAAVRRTHLLIIAYTSLIDSVKWVAPSQARKTRIVAIRGDPLASTFDRQRREIGVRNEVAFDTSLPAEPAED